MSNSVPIIKSNKHEFVEIPSSVKLAIILPTVRWTPMARSVIGAMVGVASPEVAVLIADNSEIPEKREFLKDIRRINQNVIAISHEKNVGAIDNFNYLFEWSKHVEFIAIMADDDWMSPTYHLDAYRTLLDNSAASYAEAGTTLLDSGDSNLVTINQPSVCGYTPMERITQWKGLVASVATYNASRRTTLEAAMQFLRATPLNGLLIEALFDLNRLAMGDFLSVLGHGYFVHYPATNGPGDAVKRYYDLVCKDAGLQDLFLQFIGLSQSIQCAMFLMGNLSPLVDPVQKAICGQHVFRHIYVGIFLRIASGESSRAAAAILFANYPEVMDGFLKYTTLPFSEQPTIDAELIEWFIFLLKAFEQTPGINEVSISESFSRFVNATGPYNFGLI